ncbi:MAG: Na+/H+ antiporter NhaA [Planctomycetaceae bacterium]|nr:Na+/H+ antiporter NhaA [Planctomycetaceae bacterium]
MSSQTGNRGIVRTLIDNSFLLVAGAVAALIWANLDTESYNHFVHYDVTSLWSEHDSNHAAEGHPPPVATDEISTGEFTTDQTATGQGSTGVTENAQESDHAGETHADDGEEHAGHHGLSIHFIINDILMALFFAIAAKEVWESLLPGGALANPRKAATPLLATAGGILGPALIYVAGSYLTGTYADLGRGWAVPCATDIAFSYLIARIIFGAGHPAIAFLLLLAIADDAAGLLILAVVYPTNPIVPLWLLLTVGAMALAWIMRRSGIQSHWAYLLGPGIACWWSFFQANIHPALGLVPIIPMLPHAHTDLGLFAEGESQRDDTLNAFEHFWKTPVEFFLGAFGLANAGVVLSSLGTGTWLVLAGLLIGKPVGITALTLVAEKGLKLEKPTGMDYRHVVTLGMVAGLGFTVALFVSVAAFTTPGAIQDSVKMGALLSFAAAPLAIIIGKALKIQPLKLKTAEADEAN